MTADRRRLTRPILGSLVAVALACLAWTSAHDRLAADSQRPTRTFFGGEAAAHTAFEHLQRQNATAALDAARDAVQTAPVDPAATSMLGSALLASGRPDDAYAAFMVAGALGWREVPTQLFWLAQAAAINDTDVLAQHLDALLRLDTEDEVVDNAILVLERTEAGQRALAKLLREDRPWRRRFLLSTGALDGAGLQGQIATIGRAAASGAKLDCDAVGYAADRLIDRNRPLDAKRLWRTACDRSGDGFLVNGGFETDLTTTVHSPFVWQLRPQAGLDVTVEPAPAPLQGKAVRIRSSRTVTTVAASQLTVLSPGVYRIFWTTSLDDGKSDPSISLSAQCGQGKELTSRRSAQQVTGNRMAAVFTVPARGCPFQTIAIQKAASSGGETETGWIDDIAIEQLNSLPTDAAAADR